MIKGRWKKFLSALMIGTMVCSLAGCAKGQGEKEQVTLRMTHTQQPDSISDLTAKRFIRTADYPEEILQKQLNLYRLETLTFTHVHRRTSQTMIQDFTHSGFHSYLIQQKTWSSL